MHVISNFIFIEMSRLTTDLATETEFEMAQCIPVRIG
jgi:hypothetical protein